MVLMAGAAFIPLDATRTAMVSAVATAIAALAALASTLASTQSARESSEAARQATRALSYAGKPVLELRLKEHRGVRYAVIENVSSYRTADLVLTWNLDGDNGGSRDLPPLDGMSLVAEGFTIGKRGPLCEVALPGFIPGEQVVERLVVEYAGLTGPTRWKVTYEFGPGVAENRAFDNRYYRPGRLVIDEEAL